MPAVASGMLHVVWRLARVARCMLPVVCSASSAGLRAACRLLHRCGRSFCLFAQVSVFTDGILAMDTTLVGVIKVGGSDPPAYPLHRSHPIHPAPARVGSSASAGRVESQRGYVRV